MKTPAHPVERVLAAVEKGVTITGAANVLGVTRETMRSYTRRWKSVADAIDDKRTELVDISEMALRGACLDGQAWAVTFSLRTLAPKLYGDRSEVRHSGDEANPIVIKAARSQALEAAEAAYLARLGIASANGHDRDAGESVSGESTDLVVRVRDDHSPHNGAAKI